MAQSIRLPHVLGFDFGVGVDRLSGAPMNQVVQPTPSPPLRAEGSVQSFEVTRARSTRDLQSSLGIDIDASYGCAAFGAGASARFSFMKDSHVHSSTLFMTVTATVDFSDLSIDNPSLTDSAAGLSDNNNLFKARYGDMFCRAQKRGGLFVGLMRVETFNSTEANQIEAELKGTYGLFSADVKVNFKHVIEKFDATTYCSVYTEGGPSIHIDDPSDPKELLQHANEWKDAMYRQPDQMSQPYQWMLSEITIAEGPLPPNAADIQHCQDVLTFCARERTSKFDQLNQLTWICDHPERYDWTASATLEQLITAVRGTQADLDVLASCASAAINNPSRASMPATYARKQGGIYPTGISPTPMPKENERTISLTASSPSSALFFDVPDSFVATTVLAVQFPATSNTNGEDTCIAAGVGKVIAGKLHGIARFMYLTNEHFARVGSVQGILAWPFLWPEQHPVEYRSNVVHLRLTVINKERMSVEFSDDGISWESLRTAGGDSDFSGTDPMKLALFALSESGKPYTATFTQPKITRIGGEPV